MMPADSVVLGVVAVIPHHGRWLLIRRAEGIPAGGWWCFPGGAVEKDESLADAIVREVREEVGLQVRPRHELWRRRQADGRLELSWWLAELCGPAGAIQPNPAEVAEVRWVGLAEMARLEPMLASNVSFLGLKSWPLR